MAELVKWLTRQIVALLCMGSTPIFRPILWNEQILAQRFVFLIIDNNTSGIFGCVNQSFILSYSMRMWQR